LVAALALAAAVGVGGRAVLGAVGSVEPSPPRVVEAPSSQPAVGETYVVQPGDSLWSIAAAIAPDSDPRPVVDALRAANGGPDLQVGQRLTIVID
jgi:Tfp pilus assembly protein FimV